MAVEPQRVRNRAAAGGVQEAAAALHEDSAGDSSRQFGKAAINARDELAKQLEKMHECLEDARLEAQSSSSIAEQSLKELMDVTERLAEAEEITDSATAAATSYRLQCEILTTELEQRNSELQHWKTCTESLKQELAHAQDEMKQKAPTQNQLRYEAQDLAIQIEMALRRTQSHKECESQKLLNEVSSQNIKHLEKQLMSKDEKIARLKQELEKQHLLDQDLQKKIIQLEFCFGEAQREIRKLNKILEEQDSRCLCSHMCLQQETKSSAAGSQPNNFWSNFTLPGLFSVSAIALVCIMKR
ncbi:unnamed protein product [Calypogeia fissa]